MKTAHETQNPRRPTAADVLPHDGDVIIAVEAGLLVVEAQRVQHLVFHRPDPLQAVRALQIHALAAALPPYAAVAAGVIAEGNA